MNDRNLLIHKKKTEENENSYLELFQAVTFGLTIRASVSSGCRQYGKESSWPPRLSALAERKGRTSSNKDEASHLRGISESENLKQNNLELFTDKISIRIFFIALKAITDQYVDEILILNIDEVRDDNRNDSPSPKANHLEM